MIMWFWWPVKSTVSPPLLLLYLCSCVIRLGVAQESSSSPVEKTVTEYPNPAIPASTNTNDASLNNFSREEVDDIQFAEDGFENDQNRTFQEKFTHEVDGAIQDMAAKDNIVETTLKTPATEENHLTEEYTTSAITESSTEPHMLSGTTEVPDIHEEDLSMPPVSTTTISILDNSSMTLSSDFESILLGSTTTTAKSFINATIKVVTKPTRRRITTRKSLRNITKPGRLPSNTTHIQSGNRTGRPNRKPAVRRKNGTDNTGSRFQTKNSHKTSLNRTNHHHQKKHHLNRHHTNQNGSSRHSESSPGSQRSKFPDDPKTDDDDDLLVRAYKRFKAAAVERLQQKPGSAFEDSKSVVKTSKKEGYSTEEENSSSEETYITTTKSTPTTPPVTVPPVPNTNELNSSSSSSSSEEENVEQVPKTKPTSTVKPVIKIPVTTTKRLLVQSSSSSSSSEEDEKIPVEKPKLASSFGRNTSKLLANPFQHLLVPEESQSGSDEYAGAFMMQSDSTQTTTVTVKDKVLDATTVNIPVVVVTEQLILVNTTRPDVNTTIKVTDVEVSQHPPRVTTMTTTTTTTRPTTTTTTTKRAKTQRIGTKKAKLKDVTKKRLTVGTTTKTTKKPREKGFWEASKTREVIIGALQSASNIFPGEEDKGTTTTEKMKTKKKSGKKQHKNKHEKLPSGVKGESGGKLKEKGKTEKVKLEKAHEIEKEKVGEVLAQKVDERLTGDNHNGDEIEEEDGDVSEESQEVPANVAGANEIFDSVMGNSENGNIVVEDTPESRHEGKEKPAKGKVKSSTGAKVKHGGVRDKSGKHKPDAGGRPHKKGKVKKPEENVDLTIPESMRKTSFGKAISSGAKTGQMFKDIAGRQSGNEVNQINTVYSMNAVQPRHPMNSLGAAATLSRRK